MRFALLVVCNIPITQVGVAMDDERQMSTLHPKQRGEHAGDDMVDGFVSFRCEKNLQLQNKQS